MKLDRLVLTNFRCFKNETINFDHYTALVGPNNCGKSTIFKAIDIFFRSSQKAAALTAGDFLDKAAELRIALMFSELPDVAKEEFKHYFRHDKLEFFLKAKIGENGVVQASIRGSRSGIPQFAEFHSTGGATAQKACYAKLRETFPNLPEIPQKTAVTAFEAALYEYEAQNMGAHSMIESEDLAFGAGGVAAKIKKFVDWVYIPAVKDASDEDEEAKNTAFGALITRIIRAKVKVDEKLAQIRSTAHETITTMMDDYKEQVGILEAALDEEFRKLTSAKAHVHLDFAPMNESNVSVILPLIRSKISDESFRGDISEFGHGLQRNYLITLVHVAAKLGTDDQPSLILACEEPELYQHPPQARYLFAALSKLAATEQILVTTHSPYFVSAKQFDNIRAVSKRPDTLSRVKAWSVEEQRALIAAAVGEAPLPGAAVQATLEPFLQPELAEVFFCGKLVLVEGPEDKAILFTLLEREGQLDEFLRNGCHIICAVGKPSMINLIAIARGFGIPHFVMFDGDTDCEADDREGNKVVNGKIVSLMQLPADHVWPTANRYGANSVIWMKDIQGAIQDDYQGWTDELKAVCATFGWTYKRLKKNPAVVSHTLDGALQKGAVILSLQQATAALMAWSAG